MIIVVNSQHFAQALRTVCRIVPSRPAIQVLGCVKLKADLGDVIELATTDLEVSLSVLCSAEVQAPGACVLPASSLLQLIEQLPAGNVSILCDAKGVRLQHGTFSSRLQMMSVDEFPVLPMPEGDVMKFSAEALERVIAATRYAVAERGKKHALEGALLKLAGNAMAMIATDGARLSIATAARDEGPDGSVIVPRKTLDALSMLGTGTIEFMIGSKHLFFTTSTATLTSRTIDGKFPAYERIVPRDSDKTIVVERARLAAALKRVGVAAELNCATYCSIGPNMLRLSSRSVAVGEADEQLPVRYDGEPLVICVSYKYLLDFLDVAQGETITIKMKNEKSPLLVSDGESYINVIMTMKP